MKNLSNATMILIGGLVLTAIAVFLPVMEFGDESDSVFSAMTDEEKLDMPMWIYGLLAIAVVGIALAYIGQKALAIAAAGLASGAALFIFAFFEKTISDGGEYVDAGIGLWAVLAASALTAFGVYSSAASK